MAKAKHDETSALRSLSKINGVSVNSVYRIITVDPGIHGAGNGSWGKIDYLRGVCGYLLRRDKPGRSNIFIPNDEDENGNTVISMLLDSDPQNYIRIDKIVDVAECFDGSFPCHLRSS